MKTQNGKAGASHLKKCSKFKKQALVPWVSRFSPMVDQEPHDQEVMGSNFS